MTMYHQQSGGAVKYLFLRHHSAMQITTVGVANGLAYKTS